jgi:hypothetical protein
MAESNGSSLFLYNVTRISKVFSNIHVGSSWSWVAFSHNHMAVRNHRWPKATAPSTNPSIGEVLRSLHRNRTNTNRCVMSLLILISDRSPPSWPTRNESSQQPHVRRPQPASNRADELCITPDPPEATHSRPPAQRLCLDPLKSVLYKKKKKSPSHQTCDTCMEY